MTFDDGPSAANTPRLLDLLKERKIHATFFFVGQCVQDHPEIVKRIVAEGHEIGNHSWSHPDLAKMNDAAVHDQIQKTQDAIVQACGVTPKLMRPPYGAFTSRQRSWANGTWGYKIILWDVDPEDWKYRNAEHVKAEILKQTVAGSIILSHDIHKTTVDAMPETLDTLLSKGFKFVTVSELIAMDHPATPKPKATPGPKGSKKDSTKAPASTTPAPAPAATPAPAAKPSRPRRPPGMLGDAYFQFRAQIGTGLFSLLRLAAEAGAREDTQAAVRGMQGRLRETFTFAALGPQGGGKSTLLNTLFEREFCGVAVEPATAGRVAIFQYGEEARDTAPSADVVECLRPHSFLRDFTAIEAPADASVETLTPILGRADLIFYVVSAAAGSSQDIWGFLPRLGRDLLKRLVFVVWQCDRVSAEEGAIFVKRLRQAMLRNLGQACPIFTSSTADRSGREKLERWIETEVIFAEPRRQRLREIDEVARAALREIVAWPRAERQVLEREIARVQAQRAELDECEEQSSRQVAGALWTLAQSFDGLRKHGERLLRDQLGPMDLLWKRVVSPEEFAEEIEIQTRASFTVQLHDQLLALEADLQQTAAEHFRSAGGSTPPVDPPKPPDFPRAALEETLAALDPAVDTARLVAEGYTDAVRMLQLPTLAALGVVGVVLGAVLGGVWPGELVVLAVALVVFAVVLTFFLRGNVIASFGRQFTANRAALLAGLEPALRSAAEQFYAQLAPALDTRAEELAGQLERQEPLHARLRQIEETFSRIETDIRTGLSRPPGTGETSFG